MVNIKNLAETEKYFGNSNKTGRKEEGVFKEILKYFLNNF